VINKTSKLAFFILLSNIILLILETLVLCIPPLIPLCLIKTNKSLVVLKYCVYILVYVFILYVFCIRFIILSFSIKKDGRLNSFSKSLSELFVNILRDILWLILGKIWNILSIFFDHCKADEDVMRLIFLFL